VQPGGGTTDLRRWSQMRRSLAICGFADFSRKLRRCLRPPYDLRGMVEKFRSMEFDLPLACECSRCAEATKTARFRGYQGWVFPVLAARFGR
jgi:hypothetical protein